VFGHGAFDGVVRESYPLAIVVTWAAPSVGLRRIEDIAHVRCQEVVMNMLVSDADVISRYIDYSWIIKNRRR